MRVVLFAHGEPPSAALASALLLEAELVIGADGGALVARSLGIEVDVVVGDLDSLDARERESFRVEERPWPYATDLEKAITYALEQGATEIDIVGGGGGRGDHALANLSVLRVFRGQARIRFVDERFVTELVDGSVEFEAPAGTVISLIAIGRCRGVSISGVKWELDRIELDFSPLGVHNVALGVTGRVTVAAGDLLLFRGRWVEEHA
jgi:thiamine pyrophosphokinase